MITSKVDHRLFTVYPDAVVENKATLAGTVVPRSLGSKEVMEAERVGLKLQAAATQPPTTHTCTIH